MFALGCWAAAGKAAAARSRTSAMRFIRIPSSVVLLFVRAAPAQQSQLEHDDCLVDGEAHDAQRHHAGVELRAAERALREQYILAESRLRSLHLGHDCENERDREAYPG